MPSWPGAALLTVVVNMGCVLLGDVGRWVDGDVDRCRLLTGDE